MAFRWTASPLGLGGGGGKAGFAGPAALAIFLGGSVEGEGNFAVGTSALGLVAIAGGGGLATTGPVVGGGGLRSNGGDSSRVFG
jgi:hypothetical protein